MASQSLYRKWRSQTFGDLIGQEAVTRTLLNAVREGRLAHAYLFCGPRGTGKTSTARLLAKAINCAAPQHGEPCNACISCQEIAAGRSPDVIEIDAASNNGVDHIRDLRENVNLIGSGGHSKIYIVDEAHMLSAAAFNALLKTLEEPPPHVIFVLATTEAQKVLPTIVSRCQRFDFRRITTRDIVAHLQTVAAGEGIRLEAAAADLLARAAQGGMRDALSLLDQALAYCGQEVDFERTRMMLGLADPGAVRRLIEACAQLQAAEGLHTLDALIAGGADIRQLTTQLAEEWRALTLARAGADVGRLMDRTDEEAREIGRLASAFQLEELTACARVFARSDQPARGLPIPQLGLELAFLECVGIHQRGGAPAVAVASAVGQVGQQGARPVDQQVGQRPAVSAATGGARPAVDAQAVDAPAGVAPHGVRPFAGAPAPVAASQAQDEEEQERAVDLLDALQELEEYGAEPQEAVGGAGDGGDAEDAEDAGRASADTDADVSGGDRRALLYRAQEQWDLVKQVCKQKSHSVAALLHSARPVEIDMGAPGEEPTIALQANYQFHLEKLREPTSRMAVEWALAQVLETPVRVRLVSGGSGGVGGAAGGGAGPVGGGAGMAQALAPSGGRGAAVSAAASGATHGARGAVAQAPVATREAPQRGETTLRALPASAPARGVRDGQAMYEADVAQTTMAPPANVTPIRPSTRQAVAQADVAATQAQALLDDVKADLLIQTLLRTKTLTLADVTPIEGNDEG